MCAVSHSRRVFIDMNWFWFHEYIYPNKLTNNKQKFPFESEKAHIKIAMNKIDTVFTCVLCVFVCAHGCII